MPYYVGDTIRIATASNNFDGEALTGTDADVTLSILSADDDAVPIDEAVMTWSDGEGAYLYDWDTVEVAAGAYRLQTTVIGSDGTSREVRTVVLADPDPA